MHQLFAAAKLWAALITILAAPAFAQSPEKKDPFAPSPPAEEARDPFDGDPFGGSDPFRSDPFGANPDAARDEERVQAAREEYERVRRQAIQEHLLTRAVTLSQLPFRTREFGGPDHQLLDAALTQLHLQKFGDRGNNLRGVDIFSNLSRHSWNVLEGETPAQTVRRLREEKTGKSGDEIFVNHLMKKYQEVAEDPWPLDWTRNDELWTSIAEALFASLRSDDPAEPWKRLIDADKPNADLYAAAYVGLLRSGKAESVETSLISLYVGGADENAERLRRLAESLASVAAATGENTNHPARKRLREKLLEAKLDSRALFDAAGTLACIAEYCHPSETQSVMQMLLEQESPEALDRFCLAADIPLSDQIRCYLRKPVSLKLSDVPVRDAIEICAKKVRLPLWIDESITADGPNLTIDTKGTWLETFEKTLSAADLALVPLDENILWVGPLERRAEAEKLLRASRGRIPADSEYTRRRLDEESMMEFVKTPITNACAYLKGLHAIEIQSRFHMEFGRDVPEVDCDLDRLPLHLGLTIMTKTNGFDWGVAENVIVVGPPESIADFHEMVAAHRQRRLKLSLQEHVVAEELGEMSTLEFIETPLLDVVDYLTDLHRVPVICVDRAVQDKAITQDLKGIDLAWALSLITYTHKLDWHADGDAIYVGSPAAIKTHRELSAARLARRQNHVMTVADHLQKPVKLELREAPLRTVVVKLSEASGLVIEFEKGQESLGSFATRIDTHKLPVDVQLDLLAVEYGFQWEVAGGKIILSEKAAADERE